MNRRLFVSASSASLAVAAPYFDPGNRVRGANDRIQMGLIGCGGRGRYVGGFMKEAPNTHFTALADVSLSLANRAKEWSGRPDALVFQDFRKLLERKDIDAVLVATPDHWHCLATIHSVEAGKDVYTEKPFSHNIKEGRAMVQAAAKSGRIVCAGTQQRSASHFPEVARMIQSGAIGKVSYVRVWNFINRWPKGVGKLTNGPAPADLDWDMYCGPAPLVPYAPQRHVATYRWFFDYSGGWITDYGAHRFDTVHQIMGVDAPLAVSAAGGRFNLKDDSDIPDTLQVTYDYPEFLLSYEAILTNGHGLGGRQPGMRYYNALGDMDRPNGMAFYGTLGAIFADRIGFEVYPEKGGPERTWKNTTDATRVHAQHFIDCLRTRKTPRATALIGHRSNIVPLLGNIAYKTKLKLKWDSVNETFLDAPREAHLLLGRKARKPWDRVTV